jgi:hypothetical protein
MSVVGQEACTVDGDESGVHGRGLALVVCGFLYRCCPNCVESNNSLWDQRQEN